MNHGRGCWVTHILTNVLVQPEGSLVLCNANDIQDEDVLLLGDDVLDWTVNLVEKSSKLQILRPNTSDRSSQKQRTTNTNWTRKRREDESSHLDGCKLRRGRFSGVK